MKKATRLTETSGEKTRETYLLSFMVSVVIVTH